MGFVCALVWKTKFLAQPYILFPSSTLTTLWPLSNHLEKVGFTVQCVYLFHSIRGTRQRALVSGWLAPLFIYNLGLGTPFYLTLEAARAELGSHIEGSQLWGDLKYFWVLRESFQCQPFREK